MPCLLIRYPFAPILSREKRLLLPENAHVDASSSGQLMAQTLIILTHKAIRRTILRRIVLVLSGNSKEWAQQDWSLRRADHRSTRPAVGAQARAA